MQINLTLDTSSVSAEDVRLIESISRQLAMQLAMQVATRATVQTGDSVPPVFVEGLGYPTEAKPVKTRKARGKVAEEVAEAEKLEQYQEAQLHKTSTPTEDETESDEVDEEEYTLAQAEAEFQKEEHQDPFPETPQSAYTYKGKSIPFAKFLELYKSGEAKFEDFTFGKAPEGTDFKAISDLYRPKSTVAGNGAKYRAFLNWLGGLQSAKEAKSEVYLPILDFLTSL